jgi:hypothetical protein
MKTLGSLTEVKTISFRGANGNLITITIDLQTADRIASIPTLAADDSFVMANAVQTLTNKTLPLGAGNSFLGINDTVAGYLAVSENVQSFMNGVRAMTGYGLAKGDAWTALTASEISYLAGTTSNIQGQFTTNTQEHGAINDRLTALEGGGSGGTGTTLTLLNETDSAFSDSSAAPWVFAYNQAPGEVSFTTRGSPDANTTYQIRNAGTGNLTVNGNGKNIDGAPTKVLAPDDWCWLRYIGGQYLTIDENAVVSTDDIFQSTMEVTTSTLDFTTVAWVWVKFANSAPITYDLRENPEEGLTYHLSNKSAFNVTVQGFGGVLIDGQVSLTLAAGDWAVLHFTGTGFYIAARNGSSGGGGFESGTVEMTTATLTDVNDEALVFIEKTYVGEATFSLKTSPNADDMRQIKNSAAGTLHVDSIIDLEPGDWAWLRYRGGSWYIADRSPVPLTSITATFIAGEALALNDVLVIQPNTKVYKPASVEIQSALVHESDSGAYKTRAVLLSAGVWLELLNSNGSALGSIKTLVGSDVITKAQVSHAWSSSSADTYVCNYDDTRYFFGAGNTSGTSVVFAGRASDVAMSSISRSYVGYYRSIAPMTDRSVWAFANNGTMFRLDDGGIESMIEGTTHTVQTTTGKTQRLIASFPAAALVAFQNTSTTASILWYHSFSGYSCLLNALLVASGTKYHISVHKLDASHALVTYLNDSTDLIAVLYKISSSGATGATGVVTSTVSTGFSLEQLQVSSMMVSTSTCEVAILGRVLTDPSQKLCTLQFNLADDTLVAGSIKVYAFTAQSTNGTFAGMENRGIVLAQRNTLIHYYNGTNIGTDATFAGYMDVWRLDPDTQTASAYETASLDYPFLGFAAASAVQDASVPVSMGPIVSGLSGLASGVTYGAGLNGALTPTDFQDAKIGIAISSTTLLTKVYEG